MTAESRTTELKITQKHFFATDCKKPKEKKWHNLKRKRARKKKITIENWVSLKTVVYGANYETVMSPV